MKIFHISDIHYSKSTSEKIRSVVRSLCDDLFGKVSKEDYLVVSGDLVWAGSQKDDFCNFDIDVINELIENAGFRRENIIFAPGNHDLDTARVGTGSKKFIYERVPSLAECEQLYDAEKDYFEGVFEFFNSFSNNENRVGANYYYDYDDISFLCLNTALYSVGGNKSLADDDRRLVFTTSGLEDWLRMRSSKKICLVLHHPISWLTEECRDYIESVISKNVNFVFHGHEHKKDVVQRLNDKGGAYVFSAPALFSDDAGRLGFSHLVIEGGTKVVYRQWSPANLKFVAGVDFSGNDSGEIEIVTTGVTNDQFAMRLYERNLDEALRLFSDSGVTWIDRSLGCTSENNIFGNEGEINFYAPCDLLEESNDACVIAPPEYGLTCLGHYLCLKALEKGELGFLLCLKKQRIFSREIVERVLKEIGVFEKNIDDLDFVVVDSWSDEIVKDKKKAVEQIRKAFPGKKIIFLQTSSVASGVVSGIDSEIHSSGVNKRFYLYSLSRDAVRYGVQEYRHKKNIYTGSEDQIVSKVINDFDFLNLPRTPLHCFTLLRILEGNAYENIMNRGDMVSRILSLVFYDVDIPSYSTRPDAKDCEYILSYFCAEMFKERKDVFSREEFLEFCKAICAEKFFDVDSFAIFDVLLRNRIIIQSGSGFCFRFFYWVNYFSAINMVHDEAFRQHVFCSGGYVSHPEIIEFYTGSDRKRNDALIAIKKDIDFAVRHLQEKVGKDGLFPYGDMKWLMSDDQRDAIAEHLDREVSNSSLPTQVKDQYSDKSYNPARPYQQTVDQLLSLTSAKSLMNLISCAGKALRNSDFSDAETRMSLVSSFLSGMVEINRVLVLISPLLAKSGRANFEDAGFRLIGNDWKEGVAERQFQIIRAAPDNLVKWYSLDIFSEKIGPLISASVKNETDGLRSMYLVCIAVKNTPSGWNKLIEDYIAKESKESYGLLAVFQALINEYKFGFQSESTKEKMAHLAKMCVAKHKGAKSLGREKIKKMKAPFLK